MAYRIALQLYTVREDLALNFLDGLGRVADIGYRYVEFAGFGDATAAQAGQRLQTLGLKAIGAHVPLSVLDDVEPVIDDLRAIDCASATLPWVPETMRVDWTETACRLDETAQRLAESGIEFGYHNHAFEFANGGYEKLTSAVKHAMFQLDVFWAEKSGENATEWIYKLNGKLSSLHCKDLATDGEDVELGRGTLDWKSIISSAGTVGVSDLIIEMDTPRMSPMLSAEASLQNLSKYL